MRQFCFLYDSLLNKKTIEGVLLRSECLGDGMAIFTDSGVFTTSINIFNRFRARVS